MHVGSGQVKPYKHQVMRFLGIAGYYPRFCHTYFFSSYHTTNKLVEEMPGVTPNCQAAFQKINMILSSKSTLRAPDFQKQFYLMVDVSDTKAGVILMQCDDLGIEHPVCYFSWKFDQNQNYSTIKEALALLLVIQHFDV